MRGRLLAAMCGGILVLLAAHARAGMDYGCLAACQQAGYSHQACRAHCADPNPPSRSVDPAYSAKHGTDYRCVDRCTGTGRPREYCLRNCSY